MSGISSDRLERLLKIRRAGEGAERGRWARARMEHEARLTETEAAGEKRDGVTEHLRSRVLGSLDIAALRSSAECRDALARALERSAAASRLSEVEVEARRRDLEAANRAVRAFKKLAGRSAAAESARHQASEARERDDRPRDGERP